MEYIVQAFKVIKNLVHAEANARAPKVHCSNTFPTQQKDRILNNFSARCPEGAKLLWVTKIFHQFYALVSLANIF